MKLLKKMMPRRFAGAGLAGILGLVAFLGVPESSRAQNLARDLLDRAPEIIKVLQKNPHFNNVGVLKFTLMKEGKASEHDNLLSVALANRLALALIFANSDDSKLKIIWDASAVAASLSGADHSTGKGRKKLFAANYPLAGSSEKVQADVFITGKVELSADLQKLKVHFQIIDEKDGLNELAALKPLEVSTDISGLVEWGESFLLRGPEAGKLEAEEIIRNRNKAIESAQEVRKDPKQNPLFDEKSPVVLKILYDDKEQKPEPRNGGLFIPEPLQDQKVVLRLERKDHTAARYAVVLKVNGLNTLFREPFPDLECSKWVLEPNAAPIEIEGFQMKTKKDKANPFNVLLKEESQARESIYGPHLGQISMAVFHEVSPETAKEVLPTRGLLSAVDRGSLPPGGDLAAIKKSAKQLSQEIRGRGLIAWKDAEVNFPIREVNFKVFPTPFMPVTITYYTRTKP